MKIYYSAKTGGFYNDTIYESVQIPTDALELTKTEYDALFSAQAEGKRITHNLKGFPIIADQPSVTDDEAMANLRATRNNKLTETDAAVARHRDERDSGTATTLASIEFVQLLKDRQALRDLPSNSKDPWADHMALLRPTK